MPMLSMELKATPFKPEYAGQLNFYINVVDDKLREKMITRPSVFCCAGVRMRSWHNMPWLDMTSR